MRISFRYRLIAGGGYMVVFMYLDAQQKMEVTVALGAGCQHDDDGMTNAGPQLLILKHVISS